MENDFVHQQKEPTMKEYQNASLEDVVERMKLNPANWPSLDPFFSKIIDFKIAESIQKTNNKLVKSNSDLVKATWILVIATILINIIALFFN